MEDPLVSVLMPTYNYGHFIAEAIESILVQTYSHFELIVIDDVSTDNTAQIVEAYNDERLVFIRRKEWSGSGVLPRNDGLAVSHGALIAETAADDINLPDRLERQVSFFLDHPAVDVLGGAMRLIDEKGKCISGIRHMPVYRDPRKYRQAVLRDRQVIFHPTMMFRRRVLDRVLGYNDCACSGDMEFVMRASRYFTLYNLREVLVHYRRHPDSVTRKYGDLLKLHYHKIFLIREFLWVQQHLERLKQGQQTTHNGF